MPNSVDPFRLGEVEENVAVGIERRAVVEQQRRPGGEARDQPVPHHPAAGGEVEERGRPAARPQCSRCSLRCCSSVPPARVDDAFRHAGRARREEDVERVVERQPLEGRAASARSGDRSRRASPRRQLPARPRRRRAEIGDDDDRSARSAAAAAIAAQLVGDVDRACRRTSSRRRRTNTFGSIWPKRSSTPRSPKSGEQDDQIAPSEAAASIARSSPACSASSPRRGRRCRRRRPRSACCRRETRRVELAPGQRRFDLVLAAEDDGLARRPSARSRFSAKFSRASGKKRAPGIASPSASAPAALLADDAAEIPDQVPERRRGRRPTRHAARGRTPSGGRRAPRRRA